MTLKEVTAEDLIEAAERNGYVQSHNGWFRYEKGVTTGNGYGTPKNPIIEACFMGQVAINLGVDYGDLKYELDRNYNGLGRDIVHWNDGSKMLYDEILMRFKKRISNGTVHDDIYGPIKIAKKRYSAKRKDEL